MTHHIIDSRLKNAIRNDSRLPENSSSRVSTRLTVRVSQSIRERSGESGFAGTTGANHDHARHLSLHRTRSRINSAAACR